MDLFDGGWAMPTFTSRGRLAITFAILLEDLILWGEIFTKWIRFAGFMWKQALPAHCIELVIFWPYTNTVPIIFRGKEGLPLKLLLAEDEISMSEALVDILTFHHYAVDPVFNGRDALDFALTQSYDSIILDIMMPKLDGIQVLKQLRQAGCQTPVLMLTAKSHIEDRILGLDLGADDYLPKPFAMGEFLARVRAMLRRKESFTPDVLTIGDVFLNRSNYELSGPNGQCFLLSNLEFQLMELLMLNTGIYLSSEKILTRVWGYDTEAEIGVVWVYISYLRKRLSALDAHVEIKVKRGIGYTLEVVL